VGEDEDGDGIDSEGIRDTFGERRLHLEEHKFMGRLFSVRLRAGQQRKGTSQLNKKCSQRPKREVSGAT
jgi:hypothetical protein